VLGSGIHPFDFMLGSRLEGSGEVCEYGCPPIIARDGVYAERVVLFFLDYLYD